MSQKNARCPECSSDFSGKIPFSGRMHCFNCGCRWAPLPSTARDGVSCTALVGLCGDAIKTEAAGRCVDIYNGLTWHEASQHKALLEAWQTGAEIVRTYSPTGADDGQLPEGKP